MRTNLLKLNDDKTEVLLIATRQQLSKLPEVTVKIGNVSINPTETAQNLGTYWYKTMTTTTHINRLSSQLFNTLQAINKKLDIYWIMTLLRSLCRPSSSPDWTIVILSTFGPCKKTYKSYSKSKICSVE